MRQEIQADTSSTRIVIVTDGSCKRSGGEGAWVYMIMEPEWETLGFAYVPSTTNNRMEMLGVVCALELLEHERAGCDITLVCDSEYVIFGLTQWIDGWRVRQWRTSTGKEVKNVDLWQRMDLLRKKFNINAVHVKGHIGHPENEICDAVATFSREHKITGMVAQEHFDRDVKKLIPYLKDLYKEELNADTV